MSKPVSPPNPLCDACGRMIPADSPGGVCPGCLATALLTAGGSRIESPPASRARTGQDSALDGFEIQEKLGEGGFGSVYAAQQHHPVRRRVAIKILKSGEAGGQAFLRFEAERQALALMDHPHIARVLDAGETDEGRPFFVMEFIDGLPVTEFCRTHDLPLRARLALFRQVCEAIAHAHRRGIIHRDLKPSNILVEQIDGTPVPKVIDFGIAKATDHALSDQTFVTQNNQLLGTPVYMSPEQAAGNSIGIDIRADLYSLGILLYELVTESPPFEAAALRALPYDEALRAIRTVDPPRPSLRLRQAGGALPPAARDLDAIVMKTIEKDPERRYESAVSLVRDLDRYLAGQTVAARPASPVYRFRKFVRRNRALVTAGALVALSLLAGAVVSLNLFLQARRSAQAAVENEQEGKRRFSHADFTQATPFMDDDRPGLAVAHLARAVRTDPANQAAAIRLLETLATENWPVPAHEPLQAGGHISSLAFSADGTRLFATSSGLRLSAWNGSNGEPLHTIDFEALPGSVQLSPDGKRLAVGLPPVGKIHLLDAEKYETQGVIKGPGGRSGNHFFSPDGNFLVAGYDNGHTHLWDLVERKLRHCIPQEGGFARVRFSPTGDAFATFVGRDLQLWSLDGEPRFDDPMQHERDVWGMEFTPDGDRLVSWGLDRTVRIWDAATGSLVFPPLRHGTALRQMAVSPDGERLVTTSEDGFVRLWNLADGAPLGALQHHDGPEACVAFSPDGRMFASGAAVGRIGDGAVKVWDSQTGELLFAPIYHPRGATHLAFHPDGTRLAVGSRHDEITVWDLRPRAMQPLRLRHPGPVWRARFDREDRELVTLALDGEARAWDAASGTPLTSAPATKGPVAVRAHAAAGDTLRSGFRQGRFYGQPHWSLPSFDRLVAPPYREGGVQCAAASDDGELLVTGCRDGAVRLWSLARGEALRAPIQLEEPVTAVALGPAAERLAAGTEKGDITVWNLVGGSVEFSGSAHEGGIEALAFSPDGAVLASGSLDHTARLWWGASPSDPLRHEGDVSQLSFSPDGMFLATGSRDNTVRVWTTDRGAAVAGPLRHIDTASQTGLFALWTPGNERLITTSSHDDTVRVWDPASGGLLAKPMLQPSCPLSATLDPSGTTLLTGSDFDFQSRLWHPASGEPLSPFLMNDERVLACAFDSSGQRFASGTRAGTVFVRDFPNQSDPLSSEALALAEALGGFRFDEQGILQQVPAREWHAARDRLANSPADDALAIWMRWLASDPSERAPSPFQKSAPAQ